MYINFHSIISIYKILQLLFNKVLIFTYCNSILLLFPVSILFSYGLLFYISKTEKWIPSVFIILYNSDSNFHTLFKVTINGIFLISRRLQSNGSSEISSSTSPSSILTVTLGILRDEK